MKKVLILIVLTIITGGGYWYYQQQTQTSHQIGITHSNGRLELARMDVASLYPGRVTKILVEEGQYVNQGELLAVLSSETTQAQYQAALAQQKNAIAKHRQVEKTVQHVAAQRDAQQQKLNIAQIDVDNAVKLRKNKLISPVELSKRIAARDAEKAVLNALILAEEEAKDGVQQALAGIQIAKAQTNKVNAILKDLRIKAPKAGRVQYRLVEVGNVVGAGTKIVSLLDLDDVSMHLFLSSPIVNQVALHSDARIILDGLDWVFPATVAFIASEAQFTPKYVETESERAKLMFKVKLKIPVTIAQKYRDYLRGGMTGNGYLLTNSKTKWTPNLQVKLPDSSE